MPIKVKNEAGEEVEVFSSAELEERSAAKAKEATEAAEAAAAEKFEAEKAELESKASEQEQALADAQEKLKKAEEKETNWKNLRDKNKVSEDEVAKIAKETADLRKTVSDLQSAPLETAKSTFIDSNFETGDKEQRDLFDFYYKKLSSGAKSMDEVNKALVAAFNATTGGQRQPSRAGQMQRTSVYDGYNGERDGAESEVSREFGAMLGLSAEDKKRFGNAAKSGTVGLFAKNPPKST